MLVDDLLGIGLYLGYFVVAGLPVLLLKTQVNLHSELIRKLLHFVLIFSIFPMLHLFSAWYLSILASAALVLLAYPLLMLAERSSWYKKYAVERDHGEFKSSLIVVQLALAILIAVIWGLLGDKWRYVVIVAVMAWGFGDAAAALVGKAVGRHRISHPRIEGSKTFEGTLAMYIVAGLMIFFTLLIYAGHPWQVSILVAALVAPVSAAVELFSNRGLDTITVPLTVAFLVVPLMLLISAYGGLA